MILAIWILAFLNWTRAVASKKQTGFTTGALVTLTAWQYNRVLGIILLVIAAVTALVKAFKGDGIFREPKIHKH